MKRSAGKAHNTTRGLLQAIASTNFKIAQPRILIDCSAFSREGEYIEPEIDLQLPVHAKLAKLLRKLQRDLNNNELFELRITFLIEQ